MSDTPERITSSRDGLVRVGSIGKDAGKFAVIGVTYADQTIPGREKADVHVRPGREHSRAREFRPTHIDGVEK